MGVSFRNTAHSGVAVFFIRATCPIGIVYDNNLQYMWYCLWPSATQWSTISRIIYIIFMQMVILKNISVSYICWLIDKGLHWSLLLSHFIPLSQTITHSLGTKGPRPLPFSVCSAYWSVASMPWPSSQQWPQQRSHLVKSPWKTCLEAKHRVAQWEGRAKNREEEESEQQSQIHIHRWRLLVSKVAKAALFFELWKLPSVDLILCPFLGVSWSFVFVRCFPYASA